MTTQNSVLSKSTTTMDIQPPAVWIPWLVVLSAALFFFYEFIQLNMMDAINLQLARDFNINATQVSSLSAVYFIANVIFLIPAGLLLDRISARKLILTTLTICVAATYCFGFSHDAHWAAVFRFCAGIGSAFCFLGTMRIASRWFCPTRMALVSGIIVTMAMLGGMVAQTPFTIIAHQFGWREAVFIDATLGVFIGLMILFFVKDYPPHRKNEFALLQNKLHTQGFWYGVRASYLNRQNWLCGIYTSLMNLPIFLLGALWGVPYLVQTHGFSATDASAITSTLFVGAIIGSPIIGEISDKIKKRRVIMIIGAIIALVLMFTIIYASLNTMLPLMGLFFLLGLITSSQIISYPTVTESNSKARTAMSISIISICAIGGGAIFQPIFGWLMDLKWVHTIVNGTPFYSAANYHTAFWIMPIGFIVALIAACCIRETNAQAIVEE